MLLFLFHNTEFCLSGFLDLSGGQDGCVQLWEWTYQQPISTPRPAGTYAKVTHVGFSQPGSKFGVTDSDGTLSLWQTANTSANPFWVCR